MIVWFESPTSTPRTSSCELTVVTDVVAAVPVPLPDPTASGVAAIAFPVTSRAPTTTVTGVLNDAFTVIDVVLTFWVYSM